MKKPNGISNQRGSVLVAIVLLVFTVGAAAFGTVQLASSERASSVNELEVNQAMYVGQAGLEFAKYRVDRGLSPNVSEREFSSGEFDVTSNPSGRTITAIGRVGAATKTQTIQANFSSDCVQFDTSEAYSDDHNLYNVKLVKTCNTAAVLSRMKVDWNWHPCVTGSENSNKHELLERCENDRGGARVHSISFNDAEIYNAGTGIGSPMNGIGNPDDEWIDTVDATLTSNGEYIYASNAGPIVFSRRVKPRGIYTLTAEFLDGAVITDVFQDSSAVCEAHYTRSGGMLTVDPEHAVEIKVLGSSITYGAGGPEVNVNLELGSRHGNGQLQYSNLLGGGDLDGGEYYSFTSNNLKDYTLRARGSYGSWNRTYASTNTAQVRMLFDGETPPNLQGFGGQAPIQSFMANYLDANGNVQIASNQVLVMFELGTDMVATPNSATADFQDLVVLMTISSTRELCE